MYSNPINVGYISEGVSAQSAFQQPLVGPVSTGQLSVQTGTVLHGHNAPPGFTQHYSGIPAPYGTQYSAQYLPQSAIPNPWGFLGYTTILIIWDRNDLESKRLSIAVTYVEQTIDKGKTPKRKGKFISIRLDDCSP
uniref:Uncharacterized protein n=1 Tax=Magallana gigas TaxID=29159 RepID=A0A8W8NUB6_MAGGI